MAVQVDKVFSVLDSTQIGITERRGKPISVKVYERYGEEPTTIRVRSLEGKKDKKGRPLFAMADEIPPRRSNSVQSRTLIYADDPYSILPVESCTYYYTGPHSDYQTPFQIRVGKLQED